MVYSASSYSAFFNPNIKDSTYFLKKQGAFAIVGIISMLFIIKIDYHKYKKHTKKLMLITIVLLLIVFIFQPVNGARRWIRLGPLSLQPSEITKYMIVMYMAKSLEYKGEKIKTFTYGIIPYLLVSGFYAGLVFAEKILV